MEIDGSRRVTIELFEFASLINDDYVIPSKPMILDESVFASYDSIEIKWREPESGGQNVLYYEIDAYLVPKSDLSDPFVKVKTVQTEGKVEEMKISGLMAERSYYFTVSVFSILGKTEVSGQSKFIQTTSCIQGTYLSEDRCIPCDPGEIEKET